MKKPSILPLILLILAGESIFFLPFVLVRIFRPTVLKVYEVSNLELGQCFSIYGFTALVSYLIGGPLADRFSSRKLMATGLWATALGGFLLSLYPSLQLMYLIYGFWGVSTILLFWAPLLKTTRLLGGDAYQGRSFGGLEAGRGLMAALLGAAGVALFALTAEAGTTSYVIVLTSTAGWVAGTGILVWLVLPEDRTSNESSDTSAIMLKSLKNKQVWYLAIIILCAYVGYKITDDYSLYAYEVLGFSELESAQVGSGALWLRPLFAFLAGILADRFSGSRVIAVGFACIVLGGGIIALGIVSSFATITLLTLGFTLMGVYGIRGVYFAVMKEAAISRVATGTAIGLVSVIGYTPDIFMSPLMGYLLDNNPGEVGHQLVFTTLLIFGSVGLLTSYVFESR